MNKREVGSRYEEKAAAFLEQRGYRIIERSYRCRRGEIDIIALEDGCLCFIEVKYRFSAEFGTALEAVNLQKQHTIAMTARRYLQQHGYSDQTPCRFDVVAIDGDQFELVRNAFEG